MTNNHHPDDRSWLTFRLARVLYSRRKNRRLLNEFPHVLPELIFAVGNWLDERGQRDAAALVYAEADRVDWLVNP